MLRLKKLLVPTDFSKGARSAYPYAEALTKRFGGKIDFIHIIPMLKYLNESISRLGLPLDMDKDVYPHIQTDAMARLKEELKMPPAFPHEGLEVYQRYLSVTGLCEELAPKARTRRKLDISTTGTVLNIAEGHGRTTPADQNRFMKTAEEHAFQTILMLDLLVARQEVDASRVDGGKVIQARVISMLHAWCAKNAGV